MQLANKMFVNPPVAGRELTSQERALFKPYFASNVLGQARIIDGRVPFWLSDKMCAVVIGCTIYFRSGAYLPNSKRGAQLLGHELTHVSQFLQGMTLLRYIWSCRHGYFKSQYEIEAYTMGHLIGSNFKN